MATTKVVRRKRVVPATQDESPQGPVVESVAPDYNPATAPVRLKYHTLDVGKDDNGVVNRVTAAIPYVEAAYPPHEFYVSNPLISAMRSAGAPILGSLVILGCERGNLSMRREVENIVIEWVDE